MFAWRAHALAARLGESVIYAQALALRMTSLAFITGKRSRSLDRRMAHARALVDAEGDLWDRHFVSIMQGAQALILTEFDRALEATEQAATSVESRTPFALAVQSTARAIVLPSLYWRGFARRTAELSEAWIKDAEASGDRHLEVNFRVVGAHRFLRSDDPARARNEIQLARNVRVDYVHPAFSAPWWEATIELYDGNARAAFEICVRMRKVFERAYKSSDSYRALWAVIVGGCASAVLLEQPDDVQAQAYVSLCIRMLEGTRCPLRNASLPHLQGTIDLRLGKRGQALAALENAIIAYDALGMRLWAASLRLALARHGYAHAAALERSALETFASEGIASPERWSRMLAPGLSVHRPIVATFSSASSDQ